jgi:hypothetical protein
MNVYLSVVRTGIINNFVLSLAEKEGETGFSLCRLKFCHFFCVFKSIANYWKFMKFVKSFS